eukprot:COSAG02_NODE_179_length_31090_cov_49.813785_32_plen_138_part_00
MFNDGAFNSSRTDSQQRHYNDWSESLPPGTKLVVLEIGVGTAIPKIRSKAELAAQEFEDSTLVRINLDSFDNVLEGSPEGDRKVCLKMGALAALTEIDKLIQGEEMQRQAAAAREARSERLAQPEPAPEGSTEELNR